MFIVNEFIFVDRVERLTPCQSKNQNWDLNDSRVTTPDLFQ